MTFHRRGLLGSSLLLRIDIDAAIAHVAVARTARVALEDAAQAEVHQSLVLIPRLWIGGLPMIDDGGMFHCELLAGALGLVGTVVGAVTAAGEVLAQVREHGATPSKSFGPILEVLRRVIVHAVHAA